MNKILILYIAGFIISILLTIVAYVLVVNQVFSSSIVIFVIMLLAIIQLIAQLFFFLHLAEEQNPRWNLIFFMNTVGIILLVVVGSIWIMQNLNNNTMPKNINKSILQNEGI